MLIRLEPKGKQPVASLLNRGTRTIQAAGVKAEAKSLMLPERNTVNPIFRPFGGRSDRKIDCRNGGQRNAGASQGRSVMERIRVENITPLRKQADFQQVVRYESAGRTFVGGNRK
jgi:hypothetical protein